MRKEFNSIFKSILYLSLALFLFSCTESKPVSTGSKQISTESLIVEHGPYLCQSAIKNRFGKKPSIIKNNNIAAKLEVYKGPSYQCEYTDKHISIMKDGEAIKYIYTPYISGRYILLKDDNDISFKFATIKVNNPQPKKTSRERKLSDRTVRDTCTDMFYNRRSESIKMSSIRAASVSHEGWNHYFYSTNFGDPVVGYMKCNIYSDDRPSTISITLY